MESFLRGEIHVKYEHDIRAIRRVDGNISYWIAKSQQLPGCLGRGSSVEVAIQNLIDPKGNTNGAKAYPTTRSEAFVSRMSRIVRSVKVLQKSCKTRASSAAIAKTMASRTAATETADTV